MRKIAKSKGGLDEKERRLFCMFSMELVCIGPDRPTHRRRFSRFHFMVERVVLKVVLYVSLDAQTVLCGWV